ncbi:hypothetical protein [Pontibacter sp. G13]|uniref:hypothetical protein n=1 Tax=Pontibacter sp. G13 TaxID=3074898 RepID=UPI00288B0595|nr:hypothetical protein [Pontibacter sp. G13]WNJ17372.1 hypothetical protein RJD25_21185 [Pontibacter sp. G13]
MNLRIYGWILVCLLAQSCGISRYAVGDLEVEMLTHQRIAILPSELPWDVANGWSLGSFRPIDGQGELYEALVAQSHRYPQVSIQSPAVTAQKLADITRKYDPEHPLSNAQIAKELGVDALISLEWKLSGKSKYQPIAQHTSLEKSPNAMHPGTFRNVHLTGLCYLINGDSGEPLWSMKRKQELMPEVPIDEVVRHVTRKFAANFPYRY